MEFHRTTDEFRAKYRGMDKEAFVSRLKEPFILVEFGEPEGKRKAYDTLDGRRDPDRPTEPISKKPGTPGLSLIIPLVKSNRNTFHNMVTLGRASNNDIILLHPSVSKFHAFFRLDPDLGAATVSDAGSSYGTTLDGRAIEKDEPCPLESGAVLIFANSLRARFFMAPELHDLLFP